MTDTSASATNLLYFCPQMEDVARQIVGKNPSFVMGERRWTEFSDGFPNINLAKHSLLKRGETVFLASFDSPADIYSQISVIYTLARLAESLTIVLPFFSTGFMERFNVGDEGQVITAKTTAMMLSATPVGRRGVPKIIIYDIHALQLYNYFERVVVRLKTALKYLTPELAKLNNVSICFPDEGSSKRFEGMPDKYGMDAYPQIECRKKHVSSGDHEVEIISGNPRGRHAVIVDDAFLGGGTGVACKNALFQSGAAQVSAFGTHGRFAEDSWKRFIDVGFSYVWITDSCPRVASIVASKPPFRVIPLAESISRAIAE